MVSKGNNNRKKPKPTVKPQKEEVSVDKIINSVVGILRPDLELVKKEMNDKTEKITNQIGQIGQDLKKQLVQELQDIRTHIPQPQTQPNDQEKADVLSQSDIPTGEMPTGQPQQTVMGIPVELIARGVLAYLTPKPVDNAAMYNTFQQASIRKSMAESVFEDWFMKQIKQRMAKEVLGMDIPQEVVKADEEYMKPLRDVGINAVKRDQMEKIHKQQSNMQQQSEEKHEL